MGRDNTQLEYKQWLKDELAKLLDETVTRSFRNIHDIVLDKDDKRRGTPDDVLDKIATAIARGATYKSVAQLVLVRPETFRQWVHDGRALAKDIEREITTQLDQHPAMSEEQAMGNVLATYTTGQRKKVKLARVIDMANALLEQETLDLVQDYVDTGDLTAHKIDTRLDILTRRNPAEWGKKQTIDHTIKTSSDRAVTELNRLLQATDRLSDDAVTTTDDTVIGQFKDDSTVVGED